MYLAFFNGREERGKEGLKINYRIIIILILERNYYKNLA